MQRVQVLGIDLVRFLAATSVVVWHFTGKPFLTPLSSTLRPLLPTAVASIPPGVESSWFGWIGVQIFFVISGAVIAFSAERATARSFFIGRFTRLWPTMAICAALCSLLSALVWHMPPATTALRLASSLVFFPFGPWFSGQVWTLPIEIVFYSVVWLLVLARRVDRLEHLAWALGTIALLYWLLKSASLLPGLPHLQLLLVVHGGYFAMGIVLARASTRGWTWPATVLAALCTTAAMLEIHARAAEEIGGSLYPANPWVPCLAWLLATAAIGGSLRWRNAIATMIGPRAPLFRLMGSVTYPLYLVHYQTGGPVFAALVTRGWPIWAAFVPAYLTALACALVIARYADPALSRRVKAALERLP